MSMINCAFRTSMPSRSWLKCCHWCYLTAVWCLQSCSIMTHRIVFSTCHYLGIKTPLSSQQIPEESAVCSREGAIRPRLAMRLQHALTYFQHSKCVCVCLQSNWEQISEALLNGTCKLTAKWLKSLCCYLSVSLWEALCQSSIRAVYPLPTNHLAPVVIQIFTYQLS